MKHRIIAAAVALAFSGAAWAACTTNTIVTGTRILVCTSCCSGGHCTTTCI
jgi:hypothetical protein